MSLEIEGLDLLFDILIYNKNKYIQRNISKLLCNLCLNLYDYKSDFPQKYWKLYIDKIEGLLVKLDKENDINKLNGIINLIDLIYTNSCNFEGDIPIKDDVHQVDENHELFQIHCEEKTHKDYMIYIGYNDDIYFIILLMIMKEFMIYFLKIFILLKLILKDILKLMLYKKKIFY